MSLYLLSLWSISFLTIASIYDIAPTPNLVYFIKTSVETTNVNNYFFILIPSILIFAGIIITSFFFIVKSKSRFYFSKPSKIIYSLCFIGIVVQVYLIDTKYLLDTNNKALKDSDTFIQKTILPIQTDNGLLRVIRLIRYARDFSKNINPYKIKEAPIHLHYKDRGVAVALVISDSFRYDFLSLHGNKAIRPYSPLKKIFQQYKNNIVDMGIVFSCGPNTYTGLPHIESNTKCYFSTYSKVNPLSVIMKKLHIYNIFIGKRISSFGFTSYTQMEHNHYLPSLGIVNQTIINKAIHLLKGNKNTFVFNYYEGMHPDFSFLNNHDPTPQERKTFLFGMKGTRARRLSTILIVERDLSNAIKTLMKMKKPALFFITGDHGLNKKYAHGVQEDRRFYEKHGLEAKNTEIQRQTVFLVVYNKAYEKLFPQKIKALHLNSVRFHNKLNHSFVYHSIIDAFNIKGQDLDEKRSIFSLQLKPWLR